MDIGAATGADIIAAADGEVVISTYSYSAGNYIMLDHGGGVSTVYMALLQAFSGGGGEGEAGAGDCKGGVHRLFHRLPPALWDPFRRDLCESPQLC